MFLALLLLFGILLLTCRAIGPDAPARRHGRLRMDVCDSIDQIDPVRWNSIRDRDNLLTDPAYLKTIEEADVVRCAPRYFEFHDGDRLICAMSGGVIVNDLFMFAGPALKVPASISRMLMPRFLRRRTLEIGSPMGFGVTVSCADDITQSQWRDVLRNLKRYVRHSRIQLLILRDFSTEKHPIETPLAEAGFKEFFNKPLAEMDLQWDSFEDYLMALKKTHRNNIRRKIKQKEECGIRTVIRNEIPDRLEHYNELFANVQARANSFGRDGIGTPYYRAVFKNMGRYSHCAEYLHGDTLVAFAHFISYGGRLHGDFVGLDYDVSTRAALYFNTYYDLLRFAFDNHLRTAEMGITTYEAKTDIGFSVKPLVMYAWMKSPTELKIAARLWNRLNAFRPDGCYSAFKNESYQQIWDGKTR